MSGRGSEGVGLCACVCALVVVLLFILLLFTLALFRFTCIISLTVLITGLHSSYVHLKAHSVLFL